ncbi:MAG: translocation/assembly module TamB domain-containing protein [Geobacteraceae bacterium]
MKKLTLWLGACIGIILLAAIAAAGWLLGTTAGARFLLVKSAQSAGAHLVIGKLNGRLLDELSLEQTTVTTPHFSAKIRSLRLHWQPGMLLTGNIAVQNLDLRGVDIRDYRPQTEKPLELAWPTLSGAATRVNGWISSCTLHDFSYRRNASKALIVSEMNGRIDIHGGQAAFTKVVVRTPTGTMTGDAGISFRKPLLNLFSTVTPKNPVGGFSRLFIRAELAPGKGTEQAFGRIRAVAASIQNHSIRFSADVGIARKSLQISNLDLRETGRKGNLTGKADISLAGRSPALTGQLRAEKLDLSAEIPTFPLLDGVIDLTGTLESYRGTLHLATNDTAMRSGSLGGTFSGDRKGATLVLDKGSWLDGTITGKLAVQWSDGLFLSAILNGRNINPSRVTPDWDGVVNLDLSGEIRKSDSAPLRGKISAKLLSSHLRGRQLTGELAARIDDQDIILDRLLLKGKGFDLSASGNIARKIDFDLLADDLGGLVPGTAGHLGLTGEVRRRDGRIGGNVTGSAKALRVESLKLKTASFSASLSDAKDQALKLHFAAQNLKYGSFTANEADLNISGTLDHHRLDLEASSAAGTLKTSLEGKYETANWSGNIVALSGKDTFGTWHMEQATRITVSSRGATLSSFVLSSNKGERVDLRGEWFRSPLGIILHASWQRLNLARAGQWFPALQLTGISSGTISLIAPPGDSPKISGTIQTTGTLVANGYRTQIRTGTVHLETIAGKIRADTNLDLAAQGRLTANIVTDLPKTLTLPDHGDFEAHLDEVNMGIFHTWLPEGLSLEGILSAHTVGKLLPGQKFQLTAKADIARGILRHQQIGGEIRADLRTATVSVDWHDQTLAGSIAVELADTGNLKGSFRLPLPARLPLAMNPEGAVSATIQGKVREHGIITALFPGIIQESKGELEMKLQAGDTWKNPNLSGTLLLGNASLYLPRAGIHLSDLKLAAHFERDRITVDSFSGRSGQGTINGTASVLLKNWKPVSYQGTIRGNQFQFVYLPELQVQGSPNFDFTGTMKKVTVRGDLLISDLTVAGSQAPTSIRPSEDVVIVDDIQERKRSFPLDLDIKIKVAFGDRVFVKMSGIDARLAGTVDVTMTSLEDIRGKGEIQVVKGRYKAYGVDLEITKGRISFTGGPISQPVLDILALRKVNDISAGVIVAGTINHPTIRLYSEPAMSDSDIMGYMVLGQPLSGDQGQINAVMSAAKVLLSASQSTGLNEQILNKFGIDSIGVETDKSDITKSIVTVGKYLTPKLLISYGRSLFSSTTYLKARYTFSKRWEVETWTGTESGLDVYYKINFN